MFIHVQNSEFHLRRQNFIKEAKESACKAGDLGLVPGLGRSPGGRHGNPLQYSCLENPMDRGAWQAACIP